MSWHRSSWKFLNSFPTRATGSTAAGRGTTDSKTKPETIELEKSSYQPTKADTEETFEVETDGDTVLDRLENVAQGLLRSVKILWDDRPPK